MEFIIKYADDDAKAKRLITTIKEHPGINRNELSTKLNMSTRMLKKMVYEQQAHGVIVIEPGWHGALLHYVRA